MIFAIVDDGEVVNKVVADEGYEHPTNTAIEIGDRGIDIGDRYDDVTGDIVPSPDLSISTVDTATSGEEVSVTISTGTDEAVGVTFTVDGEVFDLTVTTEQRETLLIEKTPPATVPLEATADQESIGSDTATIEVVSA